MKDSLKPGLEYELVYRVPESKTVPHLYPEAAEFQVMPRVFATGFMVGFVEWACLLAIIPAPRLAGRANRGHAREPQPFGRDAARARSAREGQAGGG